MIDEFEVYLIGYRYGQTYDQGEEVQGGPYYGSALAAYLQGLNDGVDAGAAETHVRASVTGLTSQLRAAPSTGFQDGMRRLLAERGMSYRTLAGRTFYSKSYLHDLAHGRKLPRLDVAQRIDEALGADGELTAALTGAGR